MDTCVSSDARQPMRLRRLLSWGVLGQILYVTSQFVMLFALTRFTTVEVVGAFGLASAICFPVVMFFNLGLRTNIATDVASHFYFTDFLRLRTVTSLLAYIIIAIIALAVLKGLVQEILLVFGAAKVVELFSELSYGMFQRADRLNFVAFSQAMRGIAGAGIFALFLANDYSVATAFLGQFVIWFLVAIWIDIRLACAIARTKPGMAQATWSRVAELFFTSLPLGLNGLLSAIQGNLPRYAIGTFLGLVALGQFTAVGYAMQAITTVFNAVSQSIVSRMAQYIIQNQRSRFLSVVRKLTLILIIVGVTGISLSMLIGDQLIRLMFGSEYSGLGELLALLVLVATLRSAILIYQSGLQADRAFTVIATTRLIIVFVMAGVCFLAAAWGDLFVLGIAMVFVYCLQAAVFAIKLTQISFSTSLINSTNKGS